MSVWDAIFYAWLLCGAASIVVTVADMPGHEWKPSDYVMLGYGLIWGPVTLAAAIFCWKRYR